MKKKNVITILFPALFMAIITIISFSNVTNFNKFDFKGIFIVSLLFLFPSLFLIQGIISAINGTNVFLSLGLSIISFVALMMIYMNDSAFIHIFIYLIVGSIGYIITNFVKKVLFRKKR